ncbi:MAG: hypothetical protein A2261_01385 [Candidatus Magasanikbacteria bacterium RIFOXYA2_FULL_44_8]|uniref:ATP-grasp domain-containing protein n=1 Tax=Candidatus Magasanikbacteria bacterium RIFOXYA2_FULL_44_8 TaxID=1798696 RepID=A0A1F6NL80_9BACT|nr:MAG: hypothetical protein A2261_01385 [Candidatus Magasanikbacteria bacterium RIFOXYA2_FULL_44_8]
MDILAKIKRKIGTRRIFYVCRDVERAAAGLLLGIPNYFVITNDSGYSRTLLPQYPNLILIKDCQQLDTLQLLKSKQCHGAIRPKDYVLVFKPNKQMELLCATNKWQLLNPSAELGNKVEEKISQVEWLGPLKKYLPPHQVDVLRNIIWKGDIFILQFNRAHTGGGTILIKTKKQLNELKLKFPERPTRVTKYIDGPAFTNNNIVWGGRVLSGAINYQITGLRPFTDNPFATIGNDWALPREILTPSQTKQFYAIATAVGKRLAQKGWKGLCGVDTVLDRKNNKMHLIEINARQLASVPYESELQNLHCHSERSEESCCPTFAAHIAALLSITPDDCELTQISDGSQIILRNQKINRAPNLDRLKKFKIISYDNTEIGTDRLRLQCPAGIMARHNKFNKIGKEIIYAISG